MKPVPHRGEADDGTKEHKNESTYNLLDDDGDDDDDRADHHQTYALSAMGENKKSMKKNGHGHGGDDDLTPSPTSTTTTTAHQQRSADDDAAAAAKGVSGGGFRDDDDMKNDGVAQQTDRAFYLDGSRGNSDAVVATADDLDGDDGSIRAGVVYRTYKRRWFGLVQLTLLNVIVSWDWITFSPVSQYSAAFYNVSESSINWLSTGFLFVFVAASPLTIYVLHKGPKLSIVTASVLVLAGNWIRYAGSYDRAGGRFGVVMFGQVLTGAAQTFVLSAPTTYSDLWFTSRGRVGATAIMSLANPFGAALGQLITPFLIADPRDVPDAVLYVAIIATVVAAPAIFTPAAPPTPVAPSSSVPKEALGASIRRVVRSPEVWMILIPYGVYVGFFNSISTILNQAMMPYGYTSDEAGIAGAVLIVVGLVSSAISSPILDRTKAFLLAVKVLVPVIGLMYLIFVWMPGTRAATGLAGPYVVLALLGAASFSLVPVALEYLTELAHPCSPEVTSTIAWASGQLLGGCFVLIADALKAGDDAVPPRHMQMSLVFQAALALAVVPLPLCLGLFGRDAHVGLKRTSSDRHRTRPSAA